MAQKLFQDKITTLSHSGGVITLPAGAILTIGGQQYKTASALTRTISTDVTMTALARYQVYAVLSGGVPTLRISASENSAGPAGFACWKLVGSFMANGVTGSIAFGSFINIEGVPVVAKVAMTPEWTSSGTQPAIGNGTLSGSIDRLGSKIRYEAGVRLNNGATLGTGSYRINLPAAAAIVGDAQSAVAGGDGNISMGDWFANITATATSYSGKASLNSYTSLQVVFTIDGTTSSLSGTSPAAYNIGSNSTTQGFSTIIDWAKVTGWSDTPIKDL